MKRIMAVALTVVAVAVSGRAEPTRASPGGLASLAASTAKRDVPVVAAPSASAVRPAASAPGLAPNPSDPAAMYARAMALQAAARQATDLPEPLRLLQQAAAQNYAPALVRLGDMHAEGMLGFSVNPRAARQRLCARQTALTPAHSHKEIAITSVLSVSSVVWNTSPCARKEARAPICGGVRDDIVRLLASCSLLLTPPTA